jgi:hypothetical protein
LKFAKSSHYANPSDATWIARSSLVGFLLGLEQDLECAPRLILVCRPFDNLDFAMIVPDLDSDILRKLDRNERMRQVVRALAIAACAAVAGGLAYEIFGPAFRWGMQVSRDGAVIVSLFVAMGIFLKLRKRLG